MQGGEREPPLKSVLQLQLLPAGQIGQTHQVYHPVRAGGFEDWTPEKVERSSKYLINKEIILIIFTYSNKYWRASFPICFLSHEYRPFVFVTFEISSDR